MLSVVFYLAALSPLIFAQEFTVRNYCADAIYIWEKGADTVALKPVLTMDYTQTYITSDPVTGGKDVVMSFDPMGLTNGAPKLQLSYNVWGDYTSEERALYYSLKNLNGAPFEGYKVVLEGEGGSGDCPKVLWDNGEGDEGIKYCKSYEWFELRMCQLG